MTNEQDIIDKVHAAFKDVPLPSAEALWNNHCCECSETSAAFGARPWSEISLDDLLSGRETALLSEVAWRYYLPSMIIWCIRAPKDVDVIQDNLVYQLAPPETQEQWAWEWLKPRASGFNRQQRQAIVAFLKWYQEREEEHWAGLGATPPDHAVRALSFWEREGHPGFLNDPVR
jgi:hypothetical protein